MADLAAINAVSRADAVDTLLGCCGSRRWAEAVADGRPYFDAAVLMARADAVWRSLGADDWREAFGHHPRIGGDDIDRRRFAATRERSRREQSGMGESDDALRARLATANDLYFERFGHVFLICAAGKSAAEILAAIERRLDNEPDEELLEAAEQQRQITRLRLAGLIAPQS